MEVIRRTPTETEDAPKTLLLLAQSHNGGNGMAGEIEIHIWSKSDIYREAIFCSTSVMKLNETALLFLPELPSNSVSLTRSELIYPATKVLMSLIHL